MDDKKEEPTNIAEEKSKPPKKKSCLKILLITTAALFLIFYVGARLIYLSQYTDSPATKDQTPAAANSTTTTTKQRATDKSGKSDQPQSSEKSSSEQIQSTSNIDNTMLDYFVETAVLDAADREMFITRWTASSISVGVGEGEFTQSLNGCLSSFISDFNSVSSTTKLFRNDEVGLGTPKIKIYYWEDAAFKQKAGSSIEYGFTQWNHSDDKSLQRSMLFLSKNIMNIDESVRCQIVRHEMMHAVGFWGHSDKYFEGIMALPKTRYIYPEADKRLVRMLYNSGISIGINAQATRSYFEKNTKW